MSKKDKTYMEFWQLLCTVTKKAESLDVEANVRKAINTVLETASSTKIFLRLQKTTWASSGHVSQLTQELAKEVPAAERARLTYDWAKRFGKKLEMRPRLSELQSPMLTQAYEALQKIDEELGKKA